MPRAKEIFRKSTSWITNKLALDKLVERSGQRIIFPFYHVVSNERLPHISHLYEYPDEKKFIADLEFILKYFEPLHPDDLSGEIASGKKNKFLLSFDDGLSEMYTLVAPILKRKGIPALFFLNAAFIDNRDLFYRYKISILVDKIKSGREHDREFLLHLKYHDRPIIQVYAEKAGVDFRSWLSEKKPYLTTDQISEMSANGFIFGGHSIDHPPYDEIELQEQLRQTVSSVEMVESMIRQDKKYFAFPFTDDGVSEDLFSELNKSEIKIDFTFGTAGIRKINGTHIQRIPMEKKNIGADELLKNEYTYYLMKNLVGK